MISKCQNIVINRTKFSDFEPFDVSTEGSSAEGLKLVGYIEEYNCLGEKVAKNVSINYSDMSVEAQIKEPSNYFIPNLQDFIANSYVSKTSIGSNKIVYRINSNFEGSLIQMNIPAEDVSKVFDIDGNGVNWLTLSFSRDIPLGKEMKVLINGFPTYSDAQYKIKLIDYMPGQSEAADICTLFESHKKFNNKRKTILITFVQSACNNVDEAIPENRIMNATRVEILN